MSYIIATSSTADLSRGYLLEHHIPYICYSFTMNGEVHEDDCLDESRQAAFTAMRNGAMLKTAAIPEYSYVEFFRSLMETGKDVLLLDMSVKMSTSYDSSQRAAEQVRAEFPHQRLEVMDSRCISGGLGIFVKRMVEKMEAGMSLDEVIAWGEAHKLKVAHRFTVDDLKYLKAGGRVSNAAALVGTLLSIKPVLYVPDAGTLDVLKKARGRKAALNTILEGVNGDLDLMDTPCDEINILHADCQADAEFVRQGILAKHPEVKKITITYLGMVIGAHTGPGLLAVFYFCNGRRA